MRQGTAPAEQVGAKAAAFGADAAPQIAGVLPTSPVDQTKIPHYFGPFPNWANSAYTFPDVNVIITGSGSNNFQPAQATAQVGPNGEITGVTVDEPGSGYWYANVAIRRASDGSDGGARALATVTYTAILTNITVNTGGQGYTAPHVNISAAVPLNLPRLPLTVWSTQSRSPAVDPATPAQPYRSICPATRTGIVAQARPICDHDPDVACGEQGNGIITSILVTNPGSGYSVAPGITIRDGTIEDPVRNNPGSGAKARATLTIHKVAVNTFGSGYTFAPTVAISDTPPPNITPGTGATATASVRSGV